MTKEEYLKELNEAFGDFKFYENGHYYTYKDKPISIGATGLIEQYTQDFDAQAVAERVATRDNKSIQEVLAEWQYKNKFACEKGSAIHNYTQSLFEGAELSPQMFTSWIDNEEMLKIIDKISWQSLNFYNDYKDRLELIENEKVIGSNEFDFSMIVDLSKFYDAYATNDKIENKNVKPKTKVVKSDESNKPKKRRKHFSPRIQELFDYIKTYADARDYMIYPSELIGNRPEKVCEDMGNLTSMVERLNIQYQEMVQDETVSLMKYDRTLECYMIKDIWNN